MIVNFIDHIWGGDLVEMRKDRFKNSGYQQIGVFVDIFSKTVFLEPLKNRQAGSILEMIKNVFNRTGRKPWYIFFDRESGIQSALVKSFLKKNGVELYHSFTPVKVSVAERKIRDIKQKLERYFTDTGKRRWLDILPDLEHAENHEIVSSIQMRPVDVNTENEGLVWDKLYGDLILKSPPKPKFQIGDHVRISRKRLIFTKSYEQSFSSEIFKIKAIKFTPPVNSYILVDEGGEEVQSKFLEEDLVKVPDPT